MANANTNSKQIKKQEIIILTSLIILGICIGVFGGMPYAFINLKEYREGVEFLKHQYANHYPPHSSFSNSSFYNFSHTILYLWQTIGPLALFSTLFAFIIDFKNKNYIRIIALFLPIFITFYFFSFQAVFFERNFSHIIPLYVIFASIGIYYIIQYIFAVRIVNNFIALRFLTQFILVIALLIVPFNIQYKLVHDVFGGYEENRKNIYEKRLFENYKNAEPTLIGLLSMNDIIKYKYNCNDIIFKVIDYNDDYTKHYVEIAKSKYHLKEIGYFKGAFSDLATNTLHAYVATNFIYLLKKRTELDESDVQFDCNDWIIDGSWAKNGTYIKPISSNKIDYVYGSWNGNDANTGEIRIKIPKTSIPSLLRVCVAFGPDRTKQRVGLDVDSDGQIDIEYLSYLSSVWVMWTIDISEYIEKDIALIAIDNGKSWGEWSGISQPILLHSF